MITNLKILLACLLVATLTGKRGSLATHSASGGQGACAAPLQRWQPHDFAFPAKIPARSNPFLVPFSATLSGPGGTTLEVPGFYDGDGTWKVRAAPTMVGDWTLVTHSDCAPLNGKRATFTCAPAARPNAHGPLRVDVEHPNHFVYEDGTHCYLQSFECDWLWALELGKPASGVTGKFLDKLAHNGFNEVILSAFSRDTRWKTGNTSPDDYGPPVIEAWEQHHGVPDHSRFHLAYWQHFDQVIAALNSRGMQAHLLIKVNNKKVKWPVLGSAEDDLYFRWLISRYSAYPNITWDLVKEGYNLKNLPYKLDRLRYIRAQDPYHRLLTLHDDDEPANAGKYDHLLDFLTDQQHDKLHSTILDQRARCRWPVLNAESFYEWGAGGANDKTYSVASSAESTVLAAWDIAMAGGYATHCYTYTAWDIIRPNDTPPGYALFGHLGAFFRSTPYWTLQPADDLVESDAWCLADPGREYVVFKSAADKFTLRVEGAVRPLQGRWYHPYTGLYADAGTITNGTNVINPPVNWGADPIVFHATTQPGRFSPPAKLPLFSISARD